MTGTEIVRQIMVVVNIVFVLYLIGYATILFASVVSGTITLYDKWEKKNLRNALHADYYIPISIIVPAHNEAQSIEATVRSLLDLDYRIYEIIVVDDGSTDNTAQTVISAFGMHLVSLPVRMQLPCQRATAVYQSDAFSVPVTLVRKANGGKADALNMGVNISRYPYFITMDADSLLESSALKNIIVPILENEDVIAVGGAVRPANDLVIKHGKLVSPTMPKNLLACMQVLEYDRSFLSSRVLFDQYNANMIISGAFGLFRKDIVVSVGGFEVGSLGEDMEIVIKLHVFCLSQDNPYLIKYAVDAVCWTQAPRTLGDLAIQRRRWHIGLFQSLSKYRRMLLQLENGASSWIAYVYYLIYELFSPYIEILGITAMILAGAFGLINVPFMIMFYLIYVLFGWGLSLTAFFSRLHAFGLKVTFGDAVKAIVCCLFENTFLRFFLLLVRAGSLLGYRKQASTWGKVERQQVTIE